MTTEGYRALPLGAVDIVEVVSPTEVLASKLIRRDDPYLAGHYPDFTIFPGVFVIEAAHQAVSRLIRRTGVPGAPAELDLERVDSVRFTAPLLPDDTLELHCRCHQLDNGLLRVQVDCATAGGIKAARLSLDFRIRTADV